MLEIEVVAIDDVNQEKIATVRLGKDFKKWFRNSFNLKRWSQKKFSKVFLESMSRHDLFEGVSKCKLSD